MDIFLKEPVKNMNEFLPFIQHLFPGKEFWIPPLNKKRLLIYESGSKAAVMLTLKDKGSRVKIKAEPNTRNPMYLGLIIFGILCTIGLIVALIIIYGTGSKEREQLAAETYRLINEEVGVGDATPL